MVDDYKEYLTQVYQCIPVYIFEVGALIFIIGTVSVLLICGLKESGRKIGLLLLFEYFSLILCSTVIFRGISDNAVFKLIPFDKYKNVTLDGSIYIQPELTMNVLVFIPLGFLSAHAFKGLKLRGSLLIGSGASIAIEILQYCFRRGTAEVDDFIHNVVGCIIGYGAYRCVVTFHELFFKKTIVG